MAGDWQRWYQHEIDKWQGSATVQTFSDVAYRGFHNLIMAQFQTDDGKLPNNPAQLAKLSRLGPRWAKAADEVLAEFQDDGNGRIFNATQYKAWEAARARHEAYVTRKSKRDTLPGGKPKAGDPAPIDTPSIGDRSGIDTPSIEDGSGIDNPSIDISQGIDDTKEKEKKKEKKDKDKSAGASPAPVDPVLFFPLAEGTQYGVDRSRLPGWQEAFPGVDVLHESRYFGFRCHLAITGAGFRQDSAGEPGDGGNVHRPGACESSRA